VYLPYTAHSLSISIFSVFLFLSLFVTFLFAFNRDFFFFYVVVCFCLLDVFTSGCPFCVHFCPMFFRFDLLIQWLFGFCFRVSCFLPKCVQINCGSTFVPGAFTLPCYCSPLARGILFLMGHGVLDFSGVHVHEGGCPIEYTFFSRLLMISSILSRGLLLTILF